jgi:hypothetical protein
MWVKLQLSILVLNVLVCAATYSVASVPHSEHLHTTTLTPKTCTVLENRGGYVVKTVFKANLDPVDNTLIIKVKGY